jgi:starch phosphorylase
MFIFGLSADQIQTLRASGSYRPRDLYEHDTRLKRILDALDSNLFCRKEPGLFRWITEAILDRGDNHCHLADLPAYLEAQHQVDEAFVQPSTWGAKAILNVARIGTFSSDRTVAEYAREIWGITRV